MKLAIPLLLLSTSGCAAETFQQAVANARGEGDTTDPMQRGRMGVISFAGGENEPAQPEPPPRIINDAKLGFESLKDGRICFGLDVMPSSYMMDDPASDLATLKKIPFRIEAFDALGGIPTRPIVLEGAGSLLSDVTTRGAYDQKFKVDLHYDRKENKFTDNASATMFTFVLCGKAPPTSANTKFIVVTEDGGSEEQRLYLFRVDGDPTAATTGETTPDEATAPPP